MAWETADRISDRIVDMLREELKIPGFDPVEIFAGQMLAMMAMLTKAPTSTMPPSLVGVQAAIELCIQDLLRARPPASH